MRFTEATIQNVSEAVRNEIKKNINQDRTEENSKIFNKGFFISGPTGVGKTYILNALANHFKYQFEKVNWVDYLLQSKDKMDDGYQMGKILDMVSSKVLVLDDVGAEKTTEWSIERLYIIINKAYERDTTVFIATNLSPKEFREQYGDRIFSRLNEMCSIIELSGKDRRMQYEK